MKLKHKIMIYGEEVESLIFDDKSIKITLKNGNKIKCKPICSMNLASWIDYSGNIESLKEC